MPRSKYVQLKGSSVYQIVIGPLALSLADIFQREQKLFLSLLEKFSDKSIKLRGIEHLNDPGIQIGFELLVERLTKIDTDFNIAEILRACIKI